MGKRALIVDDEPEILETTRWAFELAGFDVYTATSAEEAIPQAERLHPTTLVIDYKLPQKSGMEVLKAAKAANPQAVAIIITGLTHESEAIEAETRKAGADGFFHKPLPLDTVLRLVRDLTSARP